MRTSLSIIALLIGIGIFLVSLVAAAGISQGKETPMSDRKLYFDNQILPDNILYIFVAGSDRVRLSLAQPEEQLLLKHQYSKRRFAAALELAERGEFELAANTIEKSFQYLAETVALSEDQSAAVSSTALAKTRDFQISQLLQLKESLPVAEREKVTTVLAQLNALAIDRN